MILSLAQLNFRIADFDNNSAMMIRAIREARQRGSDLIVFPELSVCGYPPLDLLEQRDFIDACSQAIDRIADEARGIAVIVGGPVINPNTKGKKLLNAAFLLENGTVGEVRYKTLLPTYDIFDEYRYFEPNTKFDVLDFHGHRIALTICEDLWDDQPVENAFARSRLYTVSPMEELMKQNPDLIINISASPFAANRLYAREQVMKHNTTRFNLPLLYANQVGAHTELIFDGESMALNPGGEVVDRFGAFEEGVRDYLFQNAKLHALGQANSIHQNLSDEYRIEMIRKALVFGIKDYFRKMGFSGATLGLSGGIDSAVTLVLAVEALGAENLHVLMLPSMYSSDHSVSDSVLLADRLGVKANKISIQAVFDSIRSGMSPLFEGLPDDVTEENIQARIRGLMLMALANKFNRILLNTSNKSEAAVGYATLYGDMNGGLSVLGDVYKTDVYRLAQLINRDVEVIPVNILTKAPSAELRPDQKDSDSLPEYAILDTILYRYIELKQPVHDITAAGIDENTVRKVISLVNRSEYKRFQSPPILRVSGKAFGMGRRMPLVARY